MDAPSKKEVAAVATLAGIAQAALWLLLWAALLRTVPRLEKVFRDFNAELPRLTQLVISLSHLTLAYWYLPILPICLWPVVNRGVVSALWSGPEGVAGRWTWYAITWLVPLLLLAFVVIALVAPLISLLSALSA